MKHALLLLFLAASTLLSAQDCGDKLYAWERQTAGDNRFADFPKVTGKRNGPSIAGGDKALDRLIRSRLMLTQEARQNVFNLNYYFTVGCDGRVSDVIVLGDPVVSEWTNIAEIIRHTSGWQPATLGGEPVSCIYFRTLLVDGKEYPAKKDW